MSSFQASAYSYGASDEPTALEKITGLLQSAAPALDVTAQLLGKTDLEKLEVLRAKVKNYQAMSRKVPAMSWWYSNEITKFKAMIRALEVESSQEQAATNEYALLRRLTSVGGIVGIGLGCMVTYYVWKKAQK